MNVWLPDSQGVFIKGDNALSFRIAPAEDTLGSRRFRNCNLTLCCSNAVWRECSADISFGPAMPTVFKTMKCSGFALEISHLTPAFDFLKGLSPQSPLARSDAIWERQRRLFQMWTSRLAVMHAHCLLCREPRAMWVVKAPHGSGDREIMRREGGSYSHSYLSSYGLPDTLTRARERVGFSGDSVLPGYVTTVDLVFGKSCFVHLALLLLIYFKNTNTHTQISKQ